MDDEALKAAFDSFDAKNRQFHVPVAAPNARRTVLSGILEEADRQYQAKLAQKNRETAEMMTKSAEKMQEAVRALLQNRDAPAYVAAVLRVDAGRLTGRADRPYQWLWETQQFGTMLYNHLRGAKGKKLRAMKQICGEWLDRDGAPMPYRTIVTKHSGGQLPPVLPDELVRSLEEAGYPFIPPAQRDWRAHRGKIDRVLESRKRLTPGKL
jgi:hypothetical protein